MPQVFREMPVMVLTESIKAKIECHTPQKEINYASTQDRKWLANHCHWALLNGYKVTTYAI